MSDRKQLGLILLLSIISVIILACQILSTNADPTQTLPLRVSTEEIVITPTSFIPTRSAPFSDFSSPCVPYKPSVPLPVVAQNELPRAILDYLNQGGKPEELVPILETLGFAKPPFILAAVDINSDGWTDVALTLIDPSRGSMNTPPGDLLVFTCLQDGYQLTYQLSSGEIESAPMIHEALDLNADGTAELVIGSLNCGAHTCFEKLEILTWNGANLENRLIADTTNLPFPQIAVNDTDADGVFDLLVTGTGFGSVGAGPPRPIMILYSYNQVSQHWEFEREFPAAAEYRIHVIHDADTLARDGNYMQAMAGYQQVLDDVSLKDWESHDPDDLKAYARHKMILLLLILGEVEQAEDYYDELIASFPPSSPQYIFLELTVVFRDGFLAGGASSGCWEVRTFVTQHSDRVLPLFDYGYGNPQYTVEDLCPW